MSRRFQFSLRGIWNSLGDDARSVAELRPRYGRLAVTLASVAVSAVVIALREQAVSWPMMIGFIFAGSAFGSLFGGRGATIGMCLGVILGALFS